MLNPLTHRVFIFSWENIITLFKYLNGGSWKVVNEISTVTFNTRDWAETELKPYNFNNPPKRMRHSLTRDEIHFEFKEVPQARPSNGLQYLE